jgi:hypothetical protein
MGQGGITNLVLIADNVLFIGQVGYGYGYFIFAASQRCFLCLKSLFVHKSKEQVFNFLLLKHIRKLVIFP